MKDKIENIFKVSITTKQEALKVNIEKIILAVGEITKALKNGRKVIFFGNGGSAADSQHLAAEFIGRFQKERKALAAIALTTDTSILTSLGNDYSFDIVFARQMEGLGVAGDIAFGISTSGNSKNVIQGIKQAKKMGLKVITLTGHQGGQVKALSDICLIVPSHVTARIQESHLCMAHAICELVEDAFS